MSIHHRRRSRNKIETVEASPPYLTRTAPTYDILGEEQITAIEEAAEKILQEIGVEVRHEPSLKLLADAGMDIDGQRVRFPHGYCRKLIVDNAPSEFIQHARDPKKSVKIGGDALAFDAVAEVGPAGNFLSCAHTMARYKTAFYMPSNADCESFEQWTAEGGLDAAQRANSRMHKMLDEYQKPELDPAIDAALIDFMNSRRAVLPDSFA